MSHTSGPWFVECQSGGAIFVEDADGLVADIWDNGQMVDNACLIAAAPDLLATCQALVAVCDTAPPVELIMHISIVCNLAKAAIAKATCKPPQDSAS